jgi:hypothetical protein
MHGASHQRTQRIESRPLTSMGLFGFSNHVVGRSWPFRVFRAELLPEHCFIRGGRLKQPRLNP